MNYIPETIRKSVGALKDEAVSLFKTIAPKQTMYGKGKKLSKPKTQNIKKSFQMENKKRY